ncbi:MAG: EMC3/TMCO1 family protein [Candidatus Kariarchaeaceae archaeon]
MGIFSFLDPVTDAISSFLIDTGWTVPGLSTLLLLLVSLLVSSFSGMVNRAVLDMEEIAENSKKLSEHQKRKKLAKETADKKLWISVKRNEEANLELQRSMMTKRMLPSLFTMLPFIFIFQTLRSTFQQDENRALNSCSIKDNCDSRAGVVAVLPFKVNRGIPLIGKWFSTLQTDTSLSVAGFGFWYFLSAIVLSTLLQRLFGINLTGMQNPMQQQE